MPVRRGADRAGGQWGCPAAPVTHFFATLYTRGLSRTRDGHKLLCETVRCIIPIYLNNAAERGTPSMLPASCCTLGDADTGTILMAGPPNPVFSLRRCSKASEGHAQLPVCPRSRVSPVSPSVAKSCAVAFRLRGCKQATTAEDRRRAGGLPPAKLLCVVLSSCSQGPRFKALPNKPIFC